MQSWPGVISCVEFHIFSACPCGFPLGFLVYSHCSKAQWFQDPTPPRPGKSGHWRALISFPCFKIELNQTHVSKLQYLYDEIQPAGLFCEVKLTPRLPNLPTKLNSQNSLNWSAGLWWNKREKKKPPSMHIVWIYNQSDMLTSFVCDLNRWRDKNLLT